MLPKVSDTQKIGIALMSFGGLFISLGILLFFDGGLLAMGNLFILSGLLFLNGMQKTLKLCTEKERLPGTICFLGGIAVVLYGYAHIGMFYAYVFYVCCVFIY